MMIVQNYEIYPYDGLYRYRGELFTGIARCENLYDNYFKDGLFHRDDGPAIEWFDGSAAWYFDGEPYYSMESWAKAAGIYDTDDFTLIKLKWG